LIPKVGDAVALLEVVELDVTVTDETGLDEVELDCKTPDELVLVLENEVDGSTLLLLLESRDVSSYISSLLPAPQYSYLIISKLAMLKGENTKLEQCFKGP
jgi:hypothetical protein